MTEERICYAIVKEGKGLEFDDGLAKLEHTSIEAVIENDKKYGKMVPRNGKYFTWRAEDWQGKHITKKQINYGINLAWTQVELEIPIDVKRARPGEIPDFRIAFRRVADDPILTANTLMYHFYPIQNILSPNRGLCVVNVDYPWTVHGNPLSMHEIDSDHYPEHPENFPEHIEPTGDTYDFDQVYEHEGPGHGLGLPHDPLPGNNMSSNYTIMAEYITDREKARHKAKYGSRNWFKKWFYTRWINWYRRRSDRY